MASHLNLEQIERYKNLEFAFPEHTLRGAVILIPGGTGGLGAALVARLLIEQAIPIVGYLSNKERASHIKLKLESLYGGKVHLVEGDIRHATDRKKYIELASRFTGRIQGFEPRLHPVCQFVEKDQSRTARTFQSRRKARAGHQR